MRQSPDRESEWYMGWYGYMRFSEKGYVSSTEINYQLTFDEMEIYAKQEDELLEAALEMIWLQHCSICSYFPLGKTCKER